MFFIFVDLRQRRKFFDGELFPNYGNVASLVHKKTNFKYHMYTVCHTITCILVVEMKEVGM